MTRQLRSGRKEPPASEIDELSLQDEIHEPVRFIACASIPVEPVIIRRLARLPGLNGCDLRILRKKQNRLRESALLTAKATLNVSCHAARALASTLIFAQHEAGTAVCVDSRGWILTCAHCFGETAEEWKAERLKWLLYYNGLAVQVECRVWDERRDLALAKIVCVEILDEQCKGLVNPIFACVPVAESLSTSSPIFCIGQPGADNLESVSPRKTTYDLVELSRGRLCGIVAGADPQDNSDIGTLKHNAWTYWGHSGAPLLRRLDGALLGLHSSWDDATAMRHGVPLIAIRAFLREHLPTELVNLTTPV
ncbi:hypothetical protein PEX1_018480 [Penicillium expansum]|uniref:Uncharacterized protein n=1 Tax=Penicillium expansum TaxID=27334 RepID=A0A0A2K1H3_PENEN|nr:hypothetical protein PEX2_025680 [Penicillium expansum]KGO49236.1 hypothetical protein PEXP_012850 [Penicillium expansum]KGO54030.1 hypothetical protein PEX2_025680 [Penicillium expansum]KGO60723.1 hypothetical protein PEX1_018480 [Penicillium expansum]